MGAFNAWLKVVIPYILFVLEPADELPNEIIPVDVSYKNIASPIALPVNVLANIVFVKVFVPESILFVEREG